MKGIVLGVSELPSRGPAFSIQRAIVVTLVAVGAIAAGASVLRAARKGR